MTTPEIKIHFSIQLKFTLLKKQYSILNHQLLIVNYQLSTVNCQLSIVNCLLDPQSLSFADKVATQAIQSFDGRYVGVVFFGDGA